MTRTFRAAVLMGATVAAMGFAAIPAAADHHSMKIREVYPGGTASSNAEYVVLQMTAGAQNNVFGQTVRLYETGGGESGTCVFGSNPPNGENQRTLAICTSAAQTAFGTPMNCLMTNASYLSPLGGAVCFTSTVFGTIDCVSWGMFSVFTSAPAGCAGPPPPACTGTPEGTIPDNMALSRTIAPNCPTLLEDADDTNVSLADLAPVTPAPRNNASPIVETACAAGGGPAGSPDTEAPDTTITAGPSGKTKKKSATIAFEGTDARAVASFECRLDNGGFQPCTSPFSTKVKKGKHEFAVRAIDAAGNVDSTPATRSWTVKKKKKKK